MASSSLSLPDQTTISVTYTGSIRQSPDRPTTNPLRGLLDYFMGQEWRNEAICIDYPTDLFFPERGVPGEKIRDLCFTCPVRLECLEDSVSAMPKFGWAGGHPKEGRTEIRKLMREGYDLESADALVLSDSLSKIRQRKRAEQDRAFDLSMGEPVIGAFELTA